MLSLKYKTTNIRYINLQFLLSKLKEIQNLPFYFIIFGFYFIQIERQTITDLQIIINLLKSNLISNNLSNKKGIKMEGGLFGLTSTQKLYLYISQLVPSLIVLISSDLITIFALIQLFYAVSSFVYIKFLSIEKQLYPYIFYENNKLKVQRDKGLALATSGFLLITVYGILFLKIGRVVLPQTIHVGQNVTNNFFILGILLLINPLLQQWFWRLFQPKTFQQQYQKNWLINITYLIFHLMLFQKYLGLWRALPLVTLCFSLGRSMSHIKRKYGIWSAVITHYGITIAGWTLFAYIKWFTQVKII